MKIPKIPKVKTSQAIKPSSILDKYRMDKTPVTFTPIDVSPEAVSISRDSFNKTMGQVSRDYKAKSAKSVKSARDVIVD